MKVTIDITSDEAENLLFALVLRSKQNKLSLLRQNETIALGKKLESTFVETFGWYKNVDRIRNLRHPIKNVLVRYYDIAPPEE